MGLEDNPGRQPATPLPGKVVESQPITESSSIVAMSRLTADFAQNLFTNRDLSKQLASSDASMILFIPEDNQELANLNRQVGMQAEQSGEKVTYITASKIDSTEHYNNFTWDKSVNTGVTRKSNVYERSAGQE